MKRVISWCQHYVSLVKFLVMIAIGLLFCWLLNRSVDLEAVKAFGPVIASGFLGWVAYNQFKLAASQKEISQEQLALAK